jgi:sugar phosphate isomerase/epimerase
MRFPAAARERIAIASYPFREFIAGREDNRGVGGKMELKEFAAHADAKFNIKKIEPWSEHFRSLDKAYLEELRAAVARTAESLRRVAEYGAAKNVVVNLENDNPASEDPFFLVKVIEKVNSDWLHALPDFANTLAAYEEEYAYRGIEAMFGHAYNIAHVKETEVGDGKDKIAHVDLPRTFGIAKKRGYKGYFSMEWDSLGDPYAGTAGLIEKTLQDLS